MRSVFRFLLIVSVQVTFAQVEVYNVKSTSINTTYAEFGTIYLNNGLVLFASSRKNEEDKSFKKSRRKNNRQLHLELYMGQVTNLMDIAPLVQKFTTEVKNKVFESDITFSPDFKSIFFTWNNFYNTKKLDSAKWQPLRIVRAKIDDNFHISEISNLPINNTEYSVRNPCVSKDGTKLFFVSDMPGGFGDTDIYVVDISADGSLSSARNLGPTINSKKAELYPFIDQHNTLYFASYGHKGKGGLDIFKSKFQEGNYEKAVNLPSPINSKYDDFAFVINNDSNTGFFTSSRITGLGDVDIYGFTLHQGECEQSMLVKLVDNITGKPIKEAQLTVFSDDELITAETINSDFSFGLPCNKRYRLVVKKENYEAREIAFNTPKFARNRSTKIIRLKPLRCDQNVAITLLDQDTKTGISGAQVAIYKNDELLDEIVLTEKGVINYTVECSTRYIFKISKKDYLSTSLAVNASDEIGKTYRHNILLNPVKVFITIRNQQMLNVSNLRFDLDKYAINSQSASVLDEVVQIMKKYPELSLSIKIHTDSRGNDGYNLELSKNRAESTRNYLIEQGIDSNRLISQGHGETQLVNKCSNGVQCSEEEHQQNRRTEFIVLNK